MKYFSGARVNQVVHVWFLQFAKMMFEKEMEWCQKSSIRMFSILWQYRIIWYLFAGFKTITLCSVHSIYDSWNMFFLLKYDLWKLQLESWNTNHESLNRTLNLYDSESAMLLFGISLCFSQRIKTDNRCHRFDICAQSNIWLYTPIIYN